MAAATEDEAIENYVRPIQRTLSCVTERSLSFGRNQDSQYSLTFDGKQSQVPLGNTGILLVFTQGFSVEPRVFGDWKVRIDGYVYEVRDEKGALFSYDWHPHRYKLTPHFHIKQGASFRNMNKCHFPSGLIAIEVLIRFLIEEMGVPPIRSDWDEVLSANLNQFEHERSWS